MPALIAHPRGAQWDEAQTASYQAGAAQKAGDTEAAAFWRGAAAGYMAAYSDWALWQDDLTDARRTMFAVPLPLDEVRARLAAQLPRDIHRQDGDRRKRILNASGVLFGYKQATAEEPDAEECAECWNRVLTRNPDVLTTQDGAFCDTSCLHDWEVSQ